MKYFVLVGMLFLTFAFAQANECPRHKVDCKGTCGMMIDENGDGFCDRGGLSEPQHKYFVVEITGALLVLYFLSMFVLSKKMNKRMFHRKVWNYILLFTFLLSALLGLLLAASIEFDFPLHRYSHLLQHHVNCGIAMTVVAFIHFIWHFSYYFSKRKKL